VGVKVVKLVPLGQGKDQLKAFLKDVRASKTRPGFYIGLDEEGEPVMFGAEMSWRELAYLKAAFDMQFARMWLDVP
jgi:hypothetical protein